MHACMPFSPIQSLINITSTNMTTATKLADLAHRTFILGVFGATVYIGVGTVQLVNARIEKNKIMKATWDAEQMAELRRQGEMEMERQRLEQQARRQSA